MTDDQPRPPKFDLDEFRRQIARLRELGSVRDLIETIQALDPETADASSDEADQEIDLVLGLIDRMTPEERRDPSRIDDERRRAIADEAGAEPDDVAALLRQFEVMARVVEQWRRSSSSRRRPADRRAAGRPPAARRPRIDGPRLSPDDRAALLRRWDTMARAGRAPRDARPWFLLWNRGLRLWDFNIED